jgi:hypothetical protein
LRYLPYPYFLVIYKEQNVHYNDLYSIMKKLKPDSGDEVTCRNLSCVTSLFNT